MTLRNLGHQNSLFAVKIVSKQTIVEFENFIYIKRETEVLSMLANFCRPFLIGSCWVALLMWNRKFLVSRPKAQYRQIVRSLSDSALWLHGEYLYIYLRQNRSEGHRNLAKAFGLVLSWVSACTVCFYDQYMSFIQVILSCVTPHITQKLHNDDEDLLWRMATREGFSSLNSED